MDSIKKKLEDIRSKYNKKINEITKKMDNEIKELTKGLVFCSKDPYCAKYVKQKNQLKFGNYGCDDYVKKSSFYKITVEDYEVVQTYTDSGYGDDDQFRFEHTLKTYEVCPKCGRCKLIDDITLDYSTQWSRFRSEQERPNNYVPHKWIPIIKIKKGKNK